MFRLDLLLHRQSAHEDGSHLQGVDQLAVLEWSITKLQHDISSQRAHLPALQAEFERDFVAYQQLEDVMRARPDSAKVFRCERLAAEVPKFLDPTLDLSQEDWASAGPDYQEP